MAHEIKVVTTKDNWKIRTIDGIDFQAKVYEEPSEDYGIDGGNISKLWIKGILNYERGWDMKPKGKENRAMLTSLIAYFLKPENSKLK